METITLQGVETTILRIEVSSRGGGIEIDLTPFGFEGQKMAAYQNYLGGGMLGKVCVNDTIRRQTGTTDNESATKLDAIGEELKQYYHSLTNPDEDEWEHRTYIQNQDLPVSGY
jgi:hypothetical protein